MFFKSRTLLAPILTRLRSPGPVVTITRGVKGHQRIFRQRPAKYKKALSDLPPLTGLLTRRNDSLDAERIRAEKLEVYMSYLPVGSTTNLIEAIFKADDIGKLLHIIDENLVTMTSFYLGVSFEAIDDMMQARLCHRETVAVAPEFRRLCSKTIYKIRFFEADEVLKLIKCLSTLRVPENTLIVQAALQMTRNHINEFTIRELETLEDSLIQFIPVYQGKESLLLAIKEAIPLALERQIEEKQFASDEFEKIDQPEEPVGRIA